MADARFAIVPEFAPLASEAIFYKITMSAFEGTPLDIALHDVGVAAKRSLDGLAFAGGALVTDVATFCRLIERTR